MRNLPCVVMLAMLALVAVPVLAACDWAWPLHDLALAQSARAKHVLILNSYHKGYNWTDQQSDAMLDVIRQAVPSSTHDIVYMDWKRHPTQETLDDVATLLRHRYEHQPVDVILTTDDAALLFALRHRKDFLSNAPVVFSGIFERSAQAYTAQEHNVTGVYEAVDPEGTINAAMGLRPDFKHLYVIHDSSETSLALEQEIRQTVQRIQPALAMHVLTNLPFKELCRRLATLPAGSFVLLASFARDADGLVMQPERFAELMSASSSAPIFTMYDHMLGIGVVGGSLLSGVLQGEAAGRLATSILQGALVENLPPLPQKTVFYGFEYAQLQRYNLPLRRLPPGSRVLGKPFSFFEEYRELVIAVALTLGLMLLLMAIMAANIMQRRRTQQALNRMLAEWRAIFENSQVGILVLREGRKLYQANHRLAVIFGYDTPEAMHGLDAQALHTSPQAYEQFRTLHYDNLCSGKTMHLEYQFRRKDGTAFWGLISGKAVDQAQPSKGVIWVIDDITERKTAELNLQESERNYKSIIQNIKDVYYRTDKDGVLLLISPSAADMLGYDSIEEILGRNAVSFYGNPADRDVLLQRITANGHVHDYELTLLRKDGTPVAISTSSNLYYDNDGRVLGVEGIFRDISERKKAEEALEAINKTLELQVQERTQALQQRSQELEAAYSRLLDLDRLKSALLSTVSHDLRTPLTSILGFAKLILRDFSKHVQPCLASGDDKVLGKADKITENISIIIAESERLARLVNDLLDLSRIESGRMVWQDADVAVERVIQDAIRACGGDFMAKGGVQLVSKLESPLPTLHLDPDRLAQVLINLLNNASKFTESGTVSLQAWIPKPGWLHIAVADTGIGIPGDQLTKIFDRFHKIENSDTLKTAVRGSGLGLAICQEIVHHYRGRIWAESELGKGSTFHVELPA